MKKYLDKDGVLAELQDEYRIANSADVCEKLSEQIADDERKAERALSVDDPYYEHRQTFESAQKNLQQGESGLQSIESDLEAFRQFCLSEEKQLPNDSYWTKRVNDLHELEKKSTLPPKKESATKVPHVKLAEEQKTIRTLLQKEWGEALDKSQAKWQLDFLAAARQKLWERLAEWLKHLQQLADALEDLAFEPGLLFDLSRDNLTLSDIAKIKRWAEYLSKNEAVRQLCELLGRMRHEDYSKRREWIESIETFSEIRPDIHSREEYSGVRLGNSIEHALPQEKALLADDATAVLFDIKFVENRLMEFDTIGWVQHETEEAVQKEVEVTEEDEKGPLIVCVDTSGSMQGMPETIAKAVTLYLATAARQQKRNCFLINFSTGIETLDLSDTGAMKNLIHFLQKSFSGGTDATDALHHAIDKMQKDNYRNADLLVVSDFVMGELAENTHAQIEMAKNNGNRFFALSIGDFTDKDDLSIKTIFDREWRYSVNAGVRELVDIAAVVGDKPYQ